MPRPRVLLLDDSRTARAVFARALEDARLPAADVARLIRLAASAWVNRPGRAGLSPPTG